MKKFTTEKRLKKIENAIYSRQFSIRVILENIHDPHNVSAILRTCDAVGVSRIGLLYNVEKFPQISRVSSASSNKWVERDKFKSAEECVHNLHTEGFKVLGTILSHEAKSLYEFDLTQKTAFVVGNEHRGISNEMIELCDEHLYIPMRGMLQSLNVSVASAVILYEAQRQRSIKGMYDKSELSSHELDHLIDEWCKK